MTRGTGSDSDGGSFESQVLATSCWDDQGMTFVGMYEPDDVEAALARFDELCRPCDGC